MPSMSAFQKKQNSLRVKAEMEPQQIGSTSEIFTSYPAFLPLITEGETLFSWAARYHRLSGNSLANQSSIQLFGDRRAGLRHDFPSHLQKLADITQGQIGNAETLAYERTLFGFFAPFQDAQGASNVLTQMRGSSVKKVKSALGLLPSRLGAFFPLKSCQDCIRDDLKKYSVSRWHLEHQWPSVWLCRKHNKMLQALKREFQSRDLRQWLLPEDIKDGEWTRVAISLSALKSKLLWIADLSAHISKLRDIYFDNQLLRYTYLLRAKERGWLFTDGSVKLALVRQLFQKYYLGIEVIPGFDIVHSAQAEQGGMLSLLMRQYDWRRHPVKHLLLIAFLFESVAEFDATFERVRQTHAHGGTDALEEMIGEEWKFELKRLVEFERRSLSGAALAIGIPLCVAIRVAKQEGIEYLRRTHVLDATLKEKIRKMIIEGLGREEILLESGIKKTLLREFMSRDPSLRDAWRIKDFERRRENYRTNFLELIDRYRGIPVKSLRKKPGNGVSWLHRNDREWLTENLPHMKF